MYRRLLRIPIQDRSALQRMCQMQLRAYTKGKVRKPLLQRMYIGWYSMPLYFTISFFAFDKARSYKIETISETLADKDDVGKYYDAGWFEVFLYKILPLRFVSRTWGFLNQIPLPESLREPFIGLYARYFNCQLDEAQEPDLRKYRNLQEFFGRSLRDGVRQIEGDGIQSLVSPSDGKVLHFGKVTKGRLEQVKGVTYGIDDFLGPQTWRDGYQQRGSTSDKIPLNLYQRQLLHNQDTELYHCIIYLAPGDYHRYHSPSDWKVSFRRHFSGKLYSVRPSFALWFPNLFTVNERVAYIGEWQHGFFSMVPVGATNVGSIKTTFDPELVTNEALKFKFDYRDKKFSEENPSFKPGDAFGEFKLGSTIVLIFEAPKDFEFTIKRGDSLKYGQAIGHI